MHDLTCGFSQRLPEGIKIFTNQSELQVVANWSLDLTSRSKAILTTFHFLCTKLTKLLKY